MWNHPTFYLAQKWIVSDEGLSKYAIKNQEGEEVIGVGFKLKEGLTPDECAVILQMRLMVILKEINLKIPVFEKLCSARQICILNLAYNLGVATLLSFRNVLAALEKEKFSTASVELLNTAWAKDNQNRANRLAYVLEHGKINSEFFDHIQLPEISIAIDIHPRYDLKNILPSIGELNAEVRKQLERADRETREPSPVQCESVSSSVTRGQGETKSLDG